VLSGDTIIVRGPPRNGPPPERTIGLSNVTAPRLARRPGGAADAESRDEVLLVLHFFTSYIYQCHLTASCRQNINSIFRVFSSALHKYF